LNSGDDDEEEDEDEENEEGGGEVIVSVLSNESMISSGCGGALEYNHFH
jgi:hypothetical protein